MNKNSSKSITTASLGILIVKHVSKIFITIIILLLIMEGFVVQNSLRTILGFDISAIPVDPVSTAQINFTNYNTAMKKVDDGKAYQASSTPMINPFVPVPVLTKP